MGIAMIASPNGLIHGSSEILLNLDPGPAYDVAVQNATGDVRLFAGMPKGFRGRLLKKLNALDQESMAGVIRSAHFDGKRAKLIKKATKNVERSKR